MYRLSNVSVLLITPKSSLIFKRSTTSSSPPRLIDKLLIANRGEIACRVIRTARKLGIKTVAVYSDADFNSMHVSMADEAYRIGTAQSLDSYLRGDRIIDVAKRLGVQAIHPGYGFLSENKDFATECTNAGIIFIGPPPTAIDQMGNKRIAKEIMIKAKVPVVPGYQGLDQSLEKLKYEAGRIGYPVLLKAELGGGGRGMRIVERPEDLPNAIQSCRNEAKNAFKDEKILIEKYIRRSRHVELQVFVDNFDNAVYLFERDCSIQRRHQKVIEEAPASHLTDDLRKQMGQQAVNSARAVGYRNAGTVEFIFDVDENKFYFMEMNTRLQVEHPVTEMITKQDLVEWQIRIAEGKPLPLTQSDLKIHGHAFEARIYAENPDKSFSSSTGKLEHLDIPITKLGGPEYIRVDTGVRQGDTVTPFYDAMISKLIIWDHDRSLALRRLRLALENYHIAGLNTNIQFLRRVAGHPQFQSGTVDSAFIEKYKEDLFLKEDYSVPLLSVAMARIGSLLYHFNSVSNPPGDPHSLWGKSSGFRINNQLSTTEHLNSTIGDLSYEVTVYFKSDNLFDIKVTGKKESGLFSNVIATLNNGTLDIAINGEHKRAEVIQTTTGTVVQYEGQEFQFLHRVPKYSLSTQSLGTILSPVHGTIKKIYVKENQKVAKGDLLFVMEAMKMENQIKSPKSGLVVGINFQEEEVVKEKTLLLTIKDEEEETTKK